MDKINNYIQNGKKLTSGKLFLTFISVGFLIGLFFYTVASAVFQSPEIQTALKDFPTVIIKEGIVQSPQNWEKEIPELKLYLVVDNTSDTPKIQKENTFHLGRTKYILATNGMKQEHSLQGFSAEITADDIINYIKKGIIQSVLFIVLFILLFLYLGYYGTYIFSKLILSFLKKDTQSEIIKRSSFVGWISVTILNLILIFFNGGLGLFISIPTASVISVFCILKGKNEQDF